MSFDETWADLGRLIRVSAFVPGKWLRDAAKLAYDHGFVAGKREALEQFRASVPTLAPAATKAVADMAWKNVTTRVDESLALCHEQFTLNVDPEVAARALRGFGEDLFIRYSGALRQDAFKRKDAAYLAWTVKLLSAAAEQRGQQ